MKRISTAFFVVGLMLLCMATAAQAVGEIATIAGGAVRDGGQAIEGNLLYPGGVAIDSSGNIYLSDTGHNRIRMVSPAGIITTVAGNGKSGFSGDGGLATSAMLKNPMGIALDSSGNLYIADQGNQVIRKVSAGKITTVAGTGRAGYNADDIPATTASLNNPYGVAVSSAGDIYIADQSNCRIRKVSGGQITTVAGTGTLGESDGGGIAKAAQFRYPAGVAVDAAGYLYIADMGNSKIWKVSPDGKIALFAGNGTDSYGGDGLDPTLAMLNFPTGVAVAGNGDVYIADRSNEAVRKVSHGIITTYAGLGKFKGGGYTGDGGLATLAQVKHPSALALDGRGNLFIAEHGNNIIRKVAAATSIITTAVGGSGDYYGDGLQATLASFSHPYGMAMKGGELYVADVENNRIRKINALGVISTFAGNGAGGFAGDGGPATSASLNGPHGLAFSPAGELYIADTNSNRIRKVAANGNIITVAGSGGKPAGPFDGSDQPALNVSLNFPSSVAVDSSGTLYIADQQNHVVRKVKGGIVSTFAGTGTQGFNGENGLATALQLDSPWWVSVDSAGNVYIADLGNYRIRKVSTNGEMATVAGSGLTADGKAVFDGDNGPATAAKLNLPGGVVVDGKGDIYIADSYNYRVRKVGADGKITTVAGNGVWGYTGDNGPATSANLAFPTGLVVDPSGNLYIGDRGNKVIRKMTLVTTVPGRPLNVVAKALTGRATVTFAPPLSNGGSPILGYTVISNPLGGIDNNAGSGLLTHAITGLKNGVRYTFTVKARNAIGTGLSSIPSNKILMGTPPYPPVMGKATAGNARATVTFTPPANNGGWPVLGYTVTSSPAGGIDVNAGSALLSHTVIGLKNGVPYTFTVKAKNVLGFGNPSVKSNVVIPAGVPGPPLNVKAVKGNARATVSFTPPASNGGSAITGYTVTSVPAGGIDASAGKTTLSRVITGLKNGVAYTFIVKAKNALGIGLPSLPSNKVIPSP